MDDNFYINVLKSVLRRRHKTPEIFNTDQGSQHTENAFIGTFNEHNVKISVDCKGRAKW